MVNKMINMIKENDLGIPTGCSVIALNQDGNNQYAIYTDFSSDESGELKIYCGKIVNNIIVDVEKAIAEKIIADFKTNEKQALQKMEVK